LVFKADLLLETVDMSRCLHSWYCHQSVPRGRIGPEQALYL